MGLKPLSKLGTEHFPVHNILRLGTESLLQLEDIATGPCSVPNIKKKATNHMFGTHL